MGLTAIQNRFDEIRDVLRAWLVDQTDFPVIFAGSSDPRPDGPHVVFKIAPLLSKIGADDETFIDKTTGITTLRSHREFTVAIEAVGKAVGPDDELEDLIRATDILNTVHLSLDLPSVRARLSAIDLAIFNEGSVTDISQLLETEMEPRALLEIGCRARFDTADEAIYFDKTQIQGEFDTDGDGATDSNTGIIDIP